MKTITADRYRQSGQTRVEVGRFAFTVQRPTPAEVLLARNGKQLIDLPFVAAHVVGWEGVNESDLIPGGDPEPVAYDKALFSAWMEDQPDLWSPLSKALVESYQAYEEAREARGKL